MRRSAEYREPLLDLAPAVASIRKRQDNNEAIRERWRPIPEPSEAVIWDGENDERRGGQADWWLTASSDEALLDLLHRVWHCGSLRETLYANDPRSQAVLDRLKR
jgi:hypothetical protein